MKQHELDLDSMVFAELRHNLNESIKYVISQLSEKGLSEGTVTAKIKIGMMKSTDENGEVHQTAIFEPKVASKIGSSYEDKCVATGGRIQISGDGSVLIGTEQVTMDELMDDQKGA